MTIQVSLAPVVPQDITLTLTGSAQQLCAANQYRTILEFQAPSGSALTYSFTNAACAAGQTGCFTLAAGTLYRAQGAMIASPVYVNGTSSQLCVAITG